jgi:hypothetical protein
MKENRYDLAWLWLTWRLGCVRLIVSEKDMAVTRSVLYCSILNPSECPGT